MCPTSILFWATSLTASLSRFIQQAYRLPSFYLRRPSISVIILCILIGGYFTISHSFIFSMSTTPSHLSVLHTFACGRHFLLPVDEGISQTSFHSSLTFVLLFDIFYYRISSTPYIHSLPFNIFILRRAMFVLSFLYFAVVSVSFHSLMSFHFLHSLTCSSVLPFSTFTYILINVMSRHFFVVLIPVAALPLSGYTFVHSFYANGLHSFIF